ncbi:hypothetical protein CBR_g2781 [Chara braunii]|uniref:CCHC-type domain-containing protein n=1 Tax=Chara braunii TaxID=69332 RepID=A0A388KDU6_CHABU|nr:hypothetical protein CBR_g2781 [Chara braunii]|eukprot:GBG68230.1 hypothetical protein CBR_g2781 [Chara braunii]
MASNGVPNVPLARECYNCGQLGHISRFRLQPDRRLNEARPSNALVPVQPLATVPPASNVGTTVPYYAGQYNGGSGGSGLGRRVSSLEEIVGRINSKHEAEEARLRVQREEEEKRRREKQDEERRLQEKKEREEFQKEMQREISIKLDKVCEVVGGKKNGGSDEIKELKVLVESLSRQCKMGSETDQKTKKTEEIARLRFEVDRLKRGNGGASTSATVIGVTRDSEELIRLRREQAEAKATTDKCLATMEEVIFALQKQCESAEANAEV